MLPLGMTKFMDKNLEICRKTHEIRVFRKMANFFREMAKITKHIKATLI